MHRFFAALLIVGCVPVAQETGYDVVVEVTGDGAGAVSSFGIDWSDDIFCGDDCSGHIDVATVTPGFQVLPNDGSFVASWNCVLTHRDGSSATITSTEDLPTDGLFDVQSEPSEDIASATCTFSLSTNVC